MGLSSRRQSDFRAVSSLSALTEVALATWKSYKRKKVLPGDMRLSIACWRPSLPLVATSFLLVLENLLFFVVILKNVIRDFEIFCVAINAMHYEALR